MSWKKNVFSYLLWILYAVATEVGLVCLANAVCASLGMGIRVGAVSCVLYIGAAGTGVFLIHRFAPKYSPGDGKKHAAGIAARGAVIVILLAAGTALRIPALHGDGGESVYYQMAVIGGEGAMSAAMPDPSYAAGLYAGLLRGLFFFLGNKPAAAMWVQLLLQMGAILLTYFAVSKLMGNIAAIVALAFHTVSSYLIREVSVLSPVTMYLFLWTAALLVIAAAAGGRRNLWSLTAVGGMTAFLVFLDVAGCLLLFIAVAVIVSGEKPEAGGRPKCLLFFLAGAGAGFIGCVLIASLTEGKSFAGVLGAWISRYRPGGFCLPVSADAAGTAGEYAALFCVLTLGLFSFWRNRRRDPAKPWILLTAVLALAGCFGVFTEEMPMGLYMYLLLTMLAGIVVEECVRKTEAVPEAAVSVTAGTKGEQPARAGMKPPQAAQSDVKPVQAAQAGAKTMQIAPADASGAEKAPEGAGLQKPSGEQEVPVPKPVKYIENPLPLPRKHVKRKLEYGVEVPAGKDDFDLQVDERDDFDIS